MVIGAGLLQSYVIKRAKELGYCTVAVDKYKNAKGFLFADYYEPIDIVDKEKCLNYANKMNIDGVLTAATEYGVQTASYISENMGLCGLHYDIAKVMNNKFNIRNILRDKNVNDIPQFFEIKNEWQLSEMEEKLRFPVIVKPTDGSGSRAVARANNLNDLTKYWKKAMDVSKIKSTIVETFIEGNEYGVESFVSEGNIFILGIMKKIMTNPPYYAELGHLMPCGLSDKMQRKIENKVAKIIKALGINFGCVNMDLILTDMDEIHVVDIGARMGGNLIGSHVIPYGTGIDYIGNMIKAYCGDKFCFEKRKSQKNIVSRILDLSNGNGNVLDYEFSSEIGAVDIIVHMPKEKIIYNYKDNTDSCGYVVVTDSDIRNAVIKAEILRNGISLNMGKRR